ncbi:MAG: surface-adhesin E family protein [Bacillota bacterium]
MRRLMLLPLVLWLVACAHGPAQGTAARWTYIGNDPDGTQNISMLPQSTDKKKDTVTAMFNFEFTRPRDLTGPDLNQVTYIEREDLVEVDCKAQALRLLNEVYYDVEGREVFHVAPAGTAAEANQVFAGGVSDMLYDATCGEEIAWTSLGEDPQKSQDIYARVAGAGSREAAIVKARFRFVYHDLKQMVAAPSLRTIDYQSRQSSVMMDCGNQTFQLLHETYYDTDNVAVFGVTPPADSPQESVVPDSVTGLMYKAACGIPLNWTYLGTDAKSSQKIYLLGAPQRRSGDTVEAHFRFEYLAPGKLTTGADLKQVEYKTRTNDVLLDCGVMSLTLLKESYQDASGREVFSVKPTAPQAALVAPQGPTGMMLKAACKP